MNQQPQRLDSQVMFELAQIRHNLQGINTALAELVRVEKIKAGLNPDERAPNKAQE